MTIVDAGDDAHALWLPEAGRGPGILLIQEIFGVGSYIRAVAERLADAGYVVGAPDVFWRFAPGWEADHDEAGLTASLEQAGKLDPEQAVADCAAALRPPGAGSTRSPVRPACSASASVARSPSVSPWSMTRPCA